MPKKPFFHVYTKFKLHFYRNMFQHLQPREASLTTVETFCVETIMALGRPTVNEFASYMCISAPNAAYKVNSLVKKGYISRVQSETDHREYHLEVTQKYIDYYNITAGYMAEVMDRVTKRFTPEECAKFAEMLSIIDEELMPEIFTPHIHLPE